MDHIITEVMEGSIAEELDIKPGSKLLSINGSPVKDIFDYRFLIADDVVTLEIENPEGDIDEYEIEKDYDEEMGLVFDNGLMDDYKSCSNKCIFCFIDQMPKGMRPTLYFKDDDSRLSFLQGNYVTLTNMKDGDIDRIIRYRMSPINISIHTTEPELRCMMLNNRFAGKVLRYLDRLYDAEITMNAQIVLCKGINDGEHLRKTIEDLSKYAPVMQSVSIVPVGLTKYREGLYHLDPLESEDAAEVIDMVEAFQKEFLEKYGIRFIHASDEFYLLAGRELPLEENYDGYPQLENGVGMLRSFRTEFDEALKEFSEKYEASARPDKKPEYSVATGLLAAPFIRELTDRIPDVKTNVYAIKNDFFGERITVSGLICGRDLINQLKGKNLGEKLLIPVNMLRSGESYFLDDVTVKEAEEELNIKIIITPADGASLLKALHGEETEIGGRQIYEQADGSDCRKA